MPKEPNALAATCPEQKDPAGNLKRDSNTMKLRITPLNFCSALFLILAVYTFINGAKLTGMQYPHLGTAIGLIFLLFAFVVAFLDIMLRNFFPVTKTLWIVELSFITLATIIFLLVK